MKQHLQILLYLLQTFTSAIDELKTKKGNTWVQPQENQHPHPQSTPTINIFLKSRAATNDYFID